MKYLDYYKQGLKTCLAYHRQNKDIKTIIKILSSRYIKLQDIIFYLLNTYKIKNSRGQWLDYIGCEVGAQRDEVDYGNYFVVNQSHINVSKLFYFMTSARNPQNHLSLDDAEFLQKIYAYIGTNTSSGTMEDIITTIKTITEAENVEVEMASPDGLKITIDGNQLILTRNTINYVQQVLSNGIYLKEITTND